MATTVEGTWCGGGVAPYQWVAKSTEKPRRARCNTCRRRLMGMAVHCVGGELVGYAIPPHKTRSYKLRRPKGDRRGRHR